MGLTHGVKHLLAIEQFMSLNARCCLSPVDKPHESMCLTHGVKQFLPVERVMGLNCEIPLEPCGRAHESTCLNPLGLAVSS